MMLPALIALSIIIYMPYYGLCFITQRYTNTPSSSTVLLISQNKSRREKDDASDNSETLNQKKKKTEENIPGKTSAIPGMKDYEINIPLTERKWFDQADDVERKVREYTAKGMNAFKMLNLDEAALCFQMVYRMNPNAYCWHYGVVLFYLGKYQEAAQLLAHNAKQCELKFQIAASEERIWHDACCLKLKSKGSDGKGKRKKKSDPQFVPLMEENQDPIYETRKVIRIARELFAASVHGDGSAAALARAQLHSVATSGGSIYSKPKITGALGSSLDRKMWKLTAFYYLGLHYDALGEEEQSKMCMKMALRQCATSGNGVDIMHTLPMLHMTIRDWYDDDDFEADLLEDNKIPSSQKIVIEMDETSSKIPDIQPIITADGTDAATTMINSIKDSIEKMKLTELQDCLKKRSTKSSGSKSTLQARLLLILLAEAGLS